ncbi:MAG: GNAT family N-acetyltransferase [Patescibacteria group bacterium]|nr:GNAT family N-acetyltransferase [Patescibacteria group bacterium]
MTNLIVIRKAQSNDWQTIQQLNFGMYPHQAQFDPYLDMDEPFTPQSIKEYKDDASNPEKCSLIAEINGEAVGYLVGSKLIVSYRKLRLGEINHMAVSEKFRGQGIGSKLVEEFRHWCKKNNLEKISATAYYANTETINFYQKHGLKPEGIILEGKI